MPCCAMQVLVELGLLTQAELKSALVSESTAVTCHAVACCVVLCYAMQVLVGLDLLAQAELDAATMSGFTAATCSATSCCAVLCRSL
jgi:hypothetical protein